MTNEQIYHNFMQAAVSGFCANGNWNAEGGDINGQRIEHASKMAMLALEDHRKRWPFANKVTIKTKKVTPEIAGNQ